MKRLASLQAFICVTRRLSQSDNGSQQATALDVESLTEALKRPLSGSSTCLNCAISHRPASNPEFDQFLPGGNKRAQLNS